ncbi:MAG TPA: alkaline phosphatase family protein [Vicinamibacterales bacterium]|jgi:tetratricopeptide (TPR) repeat protein
MCGFDRVARSVRLALLALAWGLALSGSGATDQSGAAPTGDRIAIFGVDAADWRVIDKLVAQGRLPTFARLQLVASRGLLRSDPPLLSPIIWTTIATGRLPEDHGVLDFMVDLPGGGQAPVSGGARRVKALWEIWSNAGRRVLVAGWWATWPADHVRGLMVSDRAASPHRRAAGPPDAGVVYPPEAWERLRTGVVPADAIDYPELSRLLPVTRAAFDRAVAADRASTAALYQDPIAHFRAAIAATRTYRTLSTAAIPEVRPDLWAAYYEIVDTASHLFIKDSTRGDRAISAAYAEVDQALAQTARALDPDTLVIVVSDHGFQPADAGIREDPADLTSGASAWHRPYGIIAATTAGALTGTRPPPGFSRLGTVSPLDIAPTVLARARLPLAADMPGRVIPALAPSSPGPARVGSYGAHDVSAVPEGAGKAGAQAEFDRLRALGYVTGPAAATSLARVNLGEILYRRGDARGAARELEAVLRVSPLNEHASMWLARSYAALGRGDDALRVYDRLIHASSTTASDIDPIVFLAATDSDLAAKRVTAAAVRLTHVPDSLARTPEVLVARGAVAQAEGNAAVAERSYRAALEVAPSDTTALERLMDLLLGARRFDDAIGLTGRAARSYPSSPTHLSLAGEACLAVKRYREAERWFESALALVPDAESVSLELARTRLLDRRPDAALEALREARPSRERDMLRGGAFSAKGEWGAAIGAYELALAASAPTTDLLNALGYAQIKAGRPADGVRTIERSLAIDETQIEMRTLLDEARRQLRK